MSRGLDLGLAGLGPDRALFEAVARQLDARGVVVRAIAAASRPTATRPTSRPIRVQRLRWGLIRGVEVATAPGPAVGWPDRAHDTAEPGAILPDAPGDVRGDSAFSGRPAERVSTARGGRPRTVWTSVSAWPACGRTWGSGPEALARLQAHNAEASQVRGRIEKVFGTMKRSYTNPH